MQGFVTNKQKVINRRSTKFQGHELKSVSEAKYLGVTLTNKISWKAHTVKIVAKANNCRLFLQKNLHKCTQEIKMKCYLTYARPIIEYAASVGDPVDNKMLADSIEIIQRKAARWIKNDWGKKTFQSI